jgi:hypothetical protein
MKVSIPELTAKMADVLTKRGYAETTGEAEATVEIPDELWEEIQEL